MNGSTKPATYTAAVCGSHDFIQVNTCIHMHTNTYLYLYTYMHTEYESNYICIDIWLIYNYSSIFGILEVLWTSYADSADVAGVAA